MTAWLRTILHADMDAFYAAIEQRDRPELRGRPVIVGGSGRRGVVSTASYEARAFGVRSAMPGAEARRRCPHGVFVAPRMEAYVAEAARIRALFERYTPLVEPLSLDEAFLDVTGSRALFGDGAAIAARLRDDVRGATGLTVSIGVASSKFVAKVASDLRKPDGLVVVPPGAERAFLAPLPVARLWGAGPATVERLHALGLRSIGDVQARTRDALCGTLGEHLGAHLHALANAEDPRSVEPDREARSLSHEVTFEHDVADDERLHAVLLELAEGVGRRLRAESLHGRVVRLKLRYPPFETLMRQRALPAATDDDLAIYAMARELLDAVRPPGKPVRLIGVGVGDVAPCRAPQQRGLFDAAPRAAGNARLLRAIDDIRERFGDGAIGRGATRAWRDGG